MGLDVKSKHGIIIGFFTAAYTLPNIIHHMPFVVDAINGAGTYYRLDYIIMAIAWMAGISGCLLMLGIVTNHPGLLFPWLVSELLFSSYFAFSPICDFKGYQLILLLLGLQALLFYPICNLYIELRRRNATLNAHSRH